MTPAAFRALVFLCLAGCVSSNPTEKCTEVCAEHGMMPVGYLGGQDGAGCICSVERPKCDLAWGRADTALDLLAGCQEALVTCAGRGGR